jgi:hypothetical protein
VKEEINIMKKAQEGKYPLQNLKTGDDRGKGHDMFTTKEVLKGKYVDFHDIYRDAKESVVNQLKNEISPEILEERFNQMQKRINQEYAGGIDGLRIYFDAKHSDLLYAAGGEQVEEEREFLFRMVKTFMAASLSNNFYDLYKRTSHKAKEDLHSFVFRMAKKYTEMKANNPGAGITPYLNGEGNIQLKAK